MAGHSFWHFENILFGRFGQLLRFIANQEQHPLTKGWSLMGSVFWPILILSLYFSLVYTVLPYLKGICLSDELKNVSIKMIEISNFVISIYLAVYITKLYIEKGKIGFGCYDVDPNDKAGAHYVYIFMIGKLFHLLDSVSYAMYNHFMETRNKFMHVFHHSSMFLLSWFMAYGYPGGSSLFIVFVNSWTIVATGTVFFLSDFFIGNGTNELQKQARIIGQLIQFAVVLTHSLVGISKPCGMQEEIFVITTHYIMILMVLFTDKYKTLLLNCDATIDNE